MRKLLMFYGNKSLHFGTEYITFIISADKAQSLDEKKLTILVLGQLKNLEIQEKQESENVH